MNDGSVLEAGRVGLWPRAVDGERRAGPVQARADMALVSVVGVVVMILEAM